LCDYSGRLFERLGCRDYARFDFRADAKGTIKLLEANPNPGWCWDGKLNLMAEFAHYAYADLLTMILEAAQARCAVGVTPK
jgi:D-alanine-D-alanine ligase